jgi:hypothetical protein
MYTNNFQNYADILNHKKILYYSINIYLYAFINITFQKETAKQRDQSIRKYEQEIDSLQFRNDQVCIGYLQWFGMFMVSLLKGNVGVWLICYYCC